MATRAATDVPPGTALGVIALGFSGKDTDIQRLEKLRNDFKEHGHAYVVMVTVTYNTVDHSDRPWYRHIQADFKQQRGHVTICETIRGYKFKTVLVMLDWWYTPGNYSIERYGDVYSQNGLLDCLIGGNGVADECYIPRFNEKYEVNVPTAVGRGMFTVAPVPKEKHSLWLASRDFDTAMHGETHQSKEMREGRIALAAKGFMVARPITCPRCCLARHCCRSLTGERAGRAVLDSPCGAGTRRMIRFNAPHQEPDPVNDCRALRMSLKPPLDLIPERLDDVGAFHHRDVSNDADTAQLEEFCREAFTTPSFKFKPTRVHEPSKRIREGPTYDPENFTGHRMLYTKLHPTADIKVDGAAFAGEHLKSNKDWLAAHDTVLQNICVRVGRSVEDVLSAGVMQANKAQDAHMDGEDTFLNVTMPLTKGGRHTRFKRYDYETNRHGNRRPATWMKKIADIGGDWDALDDLDEFPADAEDAKLRSCVEFTGMVIHYGPARPDGGERYTLFVSFHAISNPPNTSTESEVFMSESFPDKISVDAALKLASSWAA